MSFFNAHFSFSFSLLLLTSLLVVHSVVAQPSTFECSNSQTPPLVLKGKRWYNSVTGEYVPLKGIAYYPRPNTGELSESQSVDFFTNSRRQIWENDIQYFVSLNINSIRIYAVNPAEWHDEFMCALQQNGIYVIIGLLADCEDCGIGSSDSKGDSMPPDCYTSTLKKRGQFIIRTFSKYENVVGFSAGNEATLYSSDRDKNTPCQKKFIADMREYVDTCYQKALARRIPIGVVGWDGNQLTMNQLQYFACGSGYEATEWYGINTYRHCDPSYQTIEELYGWQQLLDQFIFLNLSIPIIAAELGCTSGDFPLIDGFDGQRTWLQVEALYSEEYTEVFSGGVVFEYSAEKINADRSTGGYPWPYYGWMQLNYGVGYLEPVDCDNINVTCTFVPYPTFDLLAEKYAAIDTSFVPSMNEDDPIYQSPGAIPECPSDLYPLLTDIDWPTDSEEDEDLLACLATPSPTSPSTTEEPTSEPTTTTMPPTSEETSEMTTLEPAGGDETTTMSPTNEEPSTTSPPVPSWVDADKMCSSNPMCAQNGDLSTNTISECCPVNDDPTQYLDCCAAVGDFCQTPEGDLVLCQTISTAQYITDVQEGTRNAGGGGGGGGSGGGIEIHHPMSSMVLLFIGVLTMILY
jgi:hypothetical protein